MKGLEQLQPTLTVVAIDLSISLLSLVQFCMGKRKISFFFLNTLMINLIFSSNVTLAFKAWLFLPLIKPKQLNRESSQTHWSSYYPILRILPTPSPISSARLVAPVGAIHPRTELYKSDDWNFP